MELYLLHYRALTSLYGGSSHEPLRLMDGETGTGFQKLEQSQQVDARRTPQSTTSKLRLIPSKIVCAILIYVN